MMRTPDWSEDLTRSEDIDSDFEFNFQNGASPDLQCIGLEGDLQRGDSTLCRLASLLDGSGDQAGSGLPWRFRRSDVRHRGAT